MTANSILRRGVLAAVAVMTAAFVATGCDFGGGGGTGGGGELASESVGAEFVPVDALMYFSVNTDEESDAWQNINALGERFPDWETRKEEFIAELNSSSAEGVTWENDIKPWLGDEAGVAVLELDPQAAADAAESGMEEESVDVEVEANGDVYAAEADDTDATLEATVEEDATLEDEGDESGDGDSGSDGEFIIWADVDDQGAAQTFMDKIAEEEGTSEHGDYTVIEAADKESGEPIWYILTEEILVAANSEETLKRALDTKDGEENITEAEGFDDALDPVFENAVLVGFLAGDAARDIVQQSAEAEGQDLSALEDSPGYSEFHAASFAIGADEEGFRGQFHASFSDDFDTDELGESFEPTLLEELPESTLAALTGYDLGRTITQALDGLEAAGPEAAQQVEAIEAAINVKLEDVAEATHGQWVLAVMSGAPIPSGAFIFESDDEAQAQEVVNGVVDGVGTMTGTPATDVTVGDAEGRQANAGLTNVIGTVVDGNGVIASSEAFITSLQEGEGGFGDNEAYQQVRDDAGVPDELLGLLFLDTAGVRELAAGFSQEAADPNLEPLGPVVGYSDHEDQRLSFNLFVTVEEE